MAIKFSKHTLELIRLTRGEAERLGHKQIGNEHLILGMIRSDKGLGPELLKSLGVDLQDLKYSIEQALQTSHTEMISADLSLRESAENSLKQSYLEAKHYHSPFIETEHLLLSIMKDNNNAVSQYLKRSGIDAQTVETALEAYLIRKPKRKTVKQGIKILSTRLSQLFH